MRRVTFLLCLALLATGAIPRASAEVFVLKSGGRVEGQPLAASRERGQPVVLKTQEGVRLALPDSTVERVIVKSDLDKQYEARRPTLKNTVEDQWEMAQWCQDAGLAEERLRHLRNVIEIDPNHAEARKALGYRLYGSQWLTQEEQMQRLGYARYKGAWRLRQEIEIETRETQQELAVKKFRKDIRTWLEQAASGGRHADTAERNLNTINDAAAVPALAEIIGDASQPRQARLRCLAILAQFAPGAAASTLIRVALDDADQNLREACLETLVQLGPQASVPEFVKELKHKDNARINRAAECIQRVGGRQATLALINALVTEHRVPVQQGPPPGSMTTTFSQSGAPGAGGLAMGGKTQLVKQQRKNPDVLAALASFYPEVNFQYDTESWRQWYIQNQTTTDIDLRRDD